MIRGTDHILVSHAGTLPKPNYLREAVIAKAGGQSVGEEALAKHIRDSVAYVVKKQVDIGIDTINDGEMSKASFTAYIRERLGGKVWAIPSYFCFSAANSLPGDIGSSVNLIPTASYIAFATAARGGTIGTSPTPLTP